MNYNELTFLAKEKKITMSQLAKEIGMTLTGLKPSIEKGTFPINKVDPLCKVLGITPNDFIGWDAPAIGSGNYAAHIGGDNTQNSNEVIAALKDQLKEKDRQIDRLLKVVEKNAGKTK